MISYTKHPTMPLSVGFDDATHTYKLIDNELVPWEINDNVLASGTQFAGHYFPKFNAEGTAENMAKRNGRDPKEIIEEWERKKNYACDMGTRVHSCQEDMMNGKTPVQKPQNEREKQIMKSGQDAIANIKSAGWTPLNAEVVIFSPSLKLAGTVDAIFARGREIMVVDWKTNEAIHSNNKYGEMCLPPINHLESCELVKYSIQLTLYRKILLLEKYINPIAPVRLVIVHLTPDSFKAIPIEPLQEIDSMILDYLTGWRYTILNDLPF